MSNLAIYWQRANRKVFGVVALASLILAQSAFLNFGAVSAKAGQQNAALAELKRWKAEYEALKPVQAQWNETLPPISDITDRYHLFAALHLDKYGLTSSKEALLVRKPPEPVVVNGAPLNATRLCVSTGGEQGLALTAPRFSPDLLSGIDVLANRRDIEISNITLSTANGVPKAVIDLCMLFRNN
ncbi:hypothetical protein RHDC4_01568 [Rhodocyclaceae bacterium]|nr:hypothetical protein RHDC4_01568 [Rhodocyclaceae bacterium]